MLKCFATLSKITFRITHQYCSWINNYVALDYTNDPFPFTKYKRSFPLRISSVNVTEGNAKENRRKLRIWLYATKKSIIENFIFCAALKFECTEHFPACFVLLSTFQHVLYNLLIWNNVISFSILDDHQTGGNSIPM